MEKLVTNRLTYFVEKNNILNNIQSGFRKGKQSIILLDHRTLLINMPVTRDIRLVLEFFI